MLEFLTPLLPVWNVITALVRGLLAFISKPPGSYIAMAAAFALGLWWFGQHEFNAGTAANEARHVAAQAVVNHKIEIANINFANEAQANSAKALSDFLFANTRTDAFFNELKSEVSIHVTADIDRRFPLPCGFFRMWDSAALALHPSEVESDRCKADDATAPATASDLSRAAIDLWHYADLLENQVHGLIADDQGRIDAWNHYVDALSATKAETQP